MINDITLADAAEKFLNLEGRSDSSNRLYRSVLLRWLDLAHEEGLQLVGNLQDEHASLLHTKVKLVVRGQPADKTQGHPPSAATRRLWRSVMREFWEYLILEGAQLNVRRADAHMQIERSSPEPELPVAMLDATLKMAQAQAIQEGYSSPSGGEDENSNHHLIALRNYALILTLRRTGMRISEALGLRRGDIEWSQRPIRATITGKGKKDRRVYFDEPTRVALRQYLAARDAVYEDNGGLANQALFVGHSANNPGRKALTAPAAWRILKGMGREAVAELRESGEIDEDEGVETSLHPHQLRHAFATQVWQQSGDLHLTQKLLGHASPVTTVRYTHPSDEDLAARYVETIERKKR